MANQQNQLLNYGPAKTRDVITVVRDPEHILGKKFTLGADGRVTKGVEVRVARATAVMRHVPDGESMRNLLLEVSNDPHAAIIPSVFRGSEIGDEFLILSEDQIKKVTGAENRDGTKGVHEVLIAGVKRKVIGRLKENVLPSSWILLDRDVDEHTPAEHSTDDLAGWMFKVDQILPGAMGAELVVSPSTSARVLMNGKPLGGGNGHTWLRVRDPDDVERLRVAIPVRAAMSGMVWPKPRHSRSTGEVLSGKGIPTTLIDYSVLTPGRLVFVGKPVVSEGLEVAEANIVLQPALDDDVLDTQLAVIPEPAQVSELMKAVTGCEMSIKYSGVGQIKVDLFDLNLDTALETRDHGVISVRRAMQIGKPMRCQAPMRASDSWAGKFNFATATGRPFVHDVGTGVNHWLNQEEWIAVFHEQVASEFDLVELSPEEEAESQLALERNLARAGCAEELPIEFVDMDAPQAPVAPRDDVVVQDSDGFPEPFPGPMADAVKESLAHQFTRQPALTTLAVLIGMAAGCPATYCLENSTRLNLYGVGVAGTGAGKEAPRWMAVEVAAKAGSKIIGTAASGQGLEDALQDHVSILSELDEVAHTLAAANAAHAPAHLIELAKNLLILFSASRTTYRTRVLAKQKNVVQDRTIKNPCLSIIGFTTPSKLGEAVTAANIADGLLGRLLFAFGDDSATPSRKKSKPKLPESVRLAAEGIRKADSALVFKPDGATIEIALGNGVDDRLEELIREFHAACKAGKSEYEQALLVRSYEKTERVAGVLAVWDAPSAPVINLQHVEWAQRLVKASNRDILRFMTQFMHGNSALAHVATVLDVVKKVLDKKFQADKASETQAISRGVAPRTLVLRRSKLAKVDFDRAVEHLIATGELMAKAEKRESIPGRKTTAIVYLLPEDAR